MNQQEWMEKLKKDGITDLNVVALKPGIVPGEHTHDKQTIHVILKGKLIIMEKDETKIYQEGDRVEFPAGTTHRASFGPQGCTMIVGIKENS